MERCDTDAGGLEQRLLFLIGNAQSACCRFEIVGPSSHFRFKMLAMAGQLTGNLLLLGDVAHGEVDLLSAVTTHGCGHDLGIRARAIGTVTVAPGATLTATPAIPP